MDRHLSCALVVGLVAVVLLGSAVAADPPSSSGAPAKPLAANDLFPVPQAMDANVSFWRNVYAKWGLGQVALHDMEHLALVYEVVDLPEPVAEGMTREQKDYVDGRLAAMQRRLRDIAAGADDPAKLSRDDRALLARIVDVAGEGALREAPQRVRAQRGLRERFRQGLELSGRYDRVFRAVFRDAGVPEDLAYLPHVESSFQNHARSSAGAAGMWQFTAPTARQYMRVDRVIDERLDPVVAAQAAAQYLSRAYEVLGSWPLAVTSYNHGVAGMARARAEHGDDLGRIAHHYESPTFGFASRNFYAEFLAAREVASDPERHLGEAITFKPPFAYDRVILEHAASTAALARAYGLEMDALAECNPAWRSAAARGNVRLAANTALWLPAGTLRRTGLAKSHVVVTATTSVPTARAEQQAPRGGRANVHVVTRGDSLYTIAKRHKTTVSRLLALNGIRKSEAKSLRPGQTIRLPARGGASVVRVTSRKTYVVDKGDSASRIAAKHGVGLNELLALNGLTPESVLRPGQRLGIPVKR